MKHNAIKAFFTKTLNESLPGYDILSVDETLSSRNLYILEKGTMDTKIVIKSWFGTNDFNVSAYKINDNIKTKNAKLNMYKDYFLTAKGNYYQLKELGNFIQTLVKQLEITNEIKQS